MLIAHCCRRMQRNDDNGRMSRASQRGWTMIVVPFAALGVTACTVTSDDARRVDGGATTTIVDVAEAVEARQDTPATTTMVAPSSSATNVVTSPTTTTETDGSVAPPAASAPSTTTTVMSTATSTTLAPATTSTASSTTVAQPSTSTLDAHFAALAVVGEPTRVGYERGLFDHWEDINGSGCDARQDTLARQAIGFPQVDVFDRCVIVEGDWYSVYDDVIHSGSPSELDIDHVVSLAEAWDSGASTWSSSQRRQFANDPANLLAVTASSNRSKSDRDAAEWLPPATSSWCLTASITVEVKYAYGLNIDSAERAALAEMLNTCGRSDQVTLSMVSTMPLSGSASTTPTSTTASPTATTAAPSANCIDINTADLDALDQIIHVGPSRAADIIALRPFASVADLTRVSGIGSARLADIVDQGLACVK